MSPIRLLLAASAALASVVAASPAAAAVVHQMDFSGLGDNGFSFDGDWYIWSGGLGAPQIPPYGNPDPALDHTATSDNQMLGAGRLNGLTVYDNIRGAFDQTATSGVIDLSGYADVTFSFWRYLNSDYLPYMRNTVSVFDGAQWVDLETGYAFGSEPKESEWTLHAYDVSAYANANFQYRFTYVVNPPAFQVSGWNVDDVLIVGTSAAPEPAAWALMIAGFGLAGAALRRRERPIPA